jgi:hypothetical protein
MKALAKDPDRRFADMDGFSQQDLQREFGQASLHNSYRD